MPQSQGGPEFVTSYMEEVCGLFYALWVVQEASKLYLSLLIFHVSNLTYVQVEEKFLLIFKYF